MRLIDYICRKNIDYATGNYNKEFQILQGRGRT